MSDITAGIQTAAGCFIAIVILIIAAAFGLGYMWGL